ncbi:MAG: archaeosortase/exosortase family protein [Pseudonocardiales bacterium]
MTFVSGVAGRLKGRPALRLLAPALPVIAVCGLTMLAFHYSMTTLVGALSLDTPLAYVGLVPFVALAIAIPRWRGQHSEPSIHDRQLDFIVGIPLLLAALILPVMLNDRLQATFWTLRVDLLALPLFVAGTLALTYGVRAAWRVRLPLLFLLLCWPVPFIALLARTQPPVTAATTAVVARVVQPLHIAALVDTAGDSLFRVIGPDGKPFEVSLASACSGLNGTVGFLLVGAGLACVARGGRLPKALWLVAGLVLAWLLNIVRIMAILIVGQHYGSDVAINFLHPVLGLVLFAVVVLVMMAVMPIFRLSRIGEGRAGAAGAAERRREATQSAAAVPRRRPLRTTVAAIALVVGAASTMAVFNSGLQSYSAVGGNLGQAKLQSLAAETSLPPAWSSAQVGTVPWASRYFGGQAVWHRILLKAPSYPSQHLHAAPVLADVVTTPDVRRLNAYGVLACYQFHGFEIKVHDTTALGSGLRGEILSFYNKRNHKDWTTLNWEWPVVRGGKTTYERVTLMLLDTGAYGIPVVTPAGVIQPNVLDTNGGRRLQKSRDLLVALARDVIRGQVAQARQAGLSTGKQ